MEKVISYKPHKGRKVIFPQHQMCSNWMFEFDEEREAILANSMAVIAEKNGINEDDLRHMFSFLLRSLKSNSVWAS